VLDVVDPGAPLEVGIELTIPAYAPDTLLGHSIAALPFGFERPGRYEVQARTSPLPLNGDVRLSLDLVGSGERALLDSGYVDVTVGEIRTLSGRPHFAGEVMWTMEPGRRPVKGAAVRAANVDSSSPAAVVLRDVTKHYRSGRSRTNARLALPGARFDVVDGDIVALDAVSLRVAPGESVGVIGSNGAGKSTMLKAIAGVVRPTSGSVTTQGRLAAVIELGVGFHPDHTGAENLRQAATLMGLTGPEIDARFDDIVDFSGVGGAIDRQVKRYSSGMRSRLGFAVAMHVDADVLLVDEALAVGDHSFRRQVADRILELRKQGVTLLFVSHNLQLVEAVCERAVRIERGRVVDDGPVGEVIERLGGVGWTGESSSGSLDIHFHDLEVTSSVLTAGEPLGFSGWLEVVDATPTVRLEVCYRVAIEDREEIDPKDLTMMVQTVEPAGGRLMQPGWYRFEGSVQGNLINGLVDLVVSAVEGTDGEPVTEAWRTVTIGRTEDVYIAGSDRAGVSAPLYLSWGKPRRLGDAPMLD